MIHISAQPRWNILIATLDVRHDRFTSLLDSLMPQVERHAGQVHVTALWNRGERPLAHVRHDLVSNADGEYITFIDDDDVIPEYYVDEIMRALSSDVIPGVKPDYVGWQMQAYVDGAPLKPTYHSLRYDGWSEDDAGYYRDVSHLNPIRTALAQHVSYLDCSPPEDVCWASRMRGLIGSEVYIDRIMYHYRYSPKDSTWRGVTRTARRSRQVRHRGRRINITVPRPEITVPWFSYHPGSSP